MDDRTYNEAFKIYHQHRSYNRHRLPQILRGCYSEIPEVKDRRGLRILSVGPAHGHLLEEALTAVGEDVKFDRLDCVEPSELMSEELTVRMGLLAEKYNFEYKLFKRKFSNESATFLPNEFYDLVVFSHVFYYFDDQARVLQTTLNRLAHKHGRVYISVIVSTYSNLANEIHQLKEREGFVANVDQEVVTFADQTGLQQVMVDARAKVLSHAEDKEGIFVHLALKPAQACLCEHDTNMRYIGDQILAFLGHGRFPEKLRAQIQELVRKYTVDCYGFPIVPITILNYLVTRDD